MWKIIKQSGDDDMPLLTYQCSVMTLTIVQRKYGSRVWLVFKTEKEAITWATPIRWKNIQPSLIPLGIIEDVDGTEEEEENIIKKGLCQFLPPNSVGFIKGQQESKK